MTSFYIDPERCFEVPFRIPLPDRGEMATRLANIRLIMKNARERQSLSSAEHRRKLSTRPAKYRDKAKTIMKCGRLKRFIGDLSERYLDYLDFHQESLKALSPLTIQVPALCSPLDPPSLCLFGPPRQGDFDEIIRSNLSWSQFAGPVPAGWRERFLHDRRWEHGIELRALNEYSDEEREAEYAALESQRRHLEAILRTEPPRLQRKRPIPLPPPLALLSPLSLDMSPCKKGAQLRDECWAGLTERPSTQGTALSYQSSHRRPSLHVTIPGTEKYIRWLDRRLCDSPLSVGLDVSPPSVLLNADAVRAYLDNIHGPHNILPQPQLARPQSPLQELVSSKPVIKISAEQIPARNNGQCRNRKSLFTAVHPRDSSIAPPPSSERRTRQQLLPTYAMKRQVSQGSVVTTNGSSKKQRLAMPTPATTPHSLVNEKEYSSLQL